MKRDGTDKQCGREVENFSRRAQGREALSKRSYGMVGFLSSRYFNKIVRSTLILSFPINPYEVTVDNEICGPNLYSLKGKTGRINRMPVVAYNIAVPTRTIKEHGDVRVEIDDMYVNKITFVVSKYRGILLIVSEYINDRFKATLIPSIKKINKLDSNRTFRVTTLLMYPEFGPMRDGIYVLEGTTLNKKSTKEHVTKI